MPQRRPGYTDSSREAYRPGRARISQVIDLKNVDFGSNRNNRYMRINTNPSTTDLQSSNKSVRSNTRHLAAFKNPLLNKYEDDGDEEYQPKHFEFDFADNNDTQGKPKRKKSKPRPANRLSPEGQNSFINI